MARIKENYESRSKHYLTRRTPVIIRIDGKAFHTYTKGLNKPFDNDLVEDMMLTTKYLCENIQGVQIGYTQSDEISLLLTDYSTFDTQAWFGYELDKMCSIAASMATARFNELRFIRAYNLGRKYNTHWRDVETIFPSKIAMFDARAFNIPKEEVANYFLARQKDAKKNSISMLAQSMFSDKVLHGLNSQAKIDLCNSAAAGEKRMDWNKMPNHLQLGYTIRKIMTDKVAPDGSTFTRGCFSIVETPPYFNHDYFTDLVNVEQKG